MKIVNPIYDNAFKYLMDNEEIAKIVLSIILDTKVISLQSKPQETPLAMLGNIRLSRFDFKAIIRTEQGDNKTVLIEIQKYKSPNPVPRFRHYLAQNLMRTETITDNNRDEKKSLPIITIYILGFDLPEFKCKAIRTDSIPYDIIGQKPLSIKSEFVEQLTHQCFILLAVPKPEAEKKNTRIEKFINLFLQKLAYAPSNPIIDIENENGDDLEIQKVMTHLNQATLDEELIRRINAEQEHLQGIDDLEKQVEEERRQKEEANAKLLASAKQMKDYGMPIEAIQKTTGLTKEVIEKL